MHPMVTDNSHVDFLSCFAVDLHDDTKMSFENKPKKKKGKIFLYASNVIYCFLLTMDDIDETVDTD